MYISLSIYQSKKLFVTSFIQFHNFGVRIVPFFCCKPSLCISKFSLMFTHQTIILTCFITFTIFSFPFPIIKLSIFNNFSHFRCAISLSFPFPLCTFSRISFYCRLYQNITKLSHQIIRVMHII